MKLFLLRDLYTIMQIVGIILFLFGVSGESGIVVISFAFMTLGIILVIWGRSGYKKEKKKLRIEDS